MNFKNTFILFLLIGLFFVHPVYADAIIVNGGFETGDYSGWSFTVKEGASVIESPYPNIWGGYSAKIYHQNNWMWQNVDTTGTSTFSFDYFITSGTSITLLRSTLREWNYGGSLGGINLNTTPNVLHHFSRSSLNRPLSICMDMYIAWGTVYLDNFTLDNYIIPLPIPLMEFTNEPVEVGTYAHLECNLDDYWDTHANEHFYLSYDYYYKNMSNYTIVDFNELELNSENTVNLIPTYYPYFNQTGGCEIKASILYTYNDPVFTEVELGGIGYYVSTVLVNSTYEPPEEPEEPEEPEIPDPVPDPDPFPKPPIPPTQPNGTEANQSINLTWTGEYYNSVNNTFDGLCSPIYNFTNWSLSPIYKLDDTIVSFNYLMNESFTQTAQDSSILYDSINTIYGAIHPKIRNVITYYLIWVVLLIILKKD